jgi:hypothetical protein
LASQRTVREIAAATRGIRNAVATVHRVSPANRYTGNASVLWHAHPSVGATARASVAGTTLLLNAKPITPQTKSALNPDRMQAMIVGILR